MASNSINNRLLLLALVALFSVTLSQSDRIVTDDSDIQSLLDSIADDPAVSDTSQSESLNLPDASATVGRIFTYPLGLRMQPLQYKIRELGKTGLPDWLTYNVATDQLQGVPRPVDVGVSNIAVIPENPTSTSVKHFFTITVTNDNVDGHDTYANNGAELLENNGNTNQNEDKNANKNDKQCRRDDPVTIVSVVVDADHDVLDGVAKASVLKKMASFLNLVAERLRLLPLESGNAYDSSALVAGPGDQNKQEHSGLKVTWQIGCGSVDSDSMHLLEKVEFTAQNGKMAAAIGHPVVGWHVTNNKPRMIVVRKRRQAPVASPTFEPTPPTSTASLETELARTVPSMSSPSFSKHPPRRTKTTGRHTNGKGTVYKYASPMSTPMMTPVVPTPVVPTPAATETITELIRPTEVYASSSEKETSPEIPVARTDILVQPSHTVTEETHISPTPTESLPTDRYSVVDSETTSKPSVTPPTVSSSEMEIDIVPTETVNENPYVNRQMKRIEAKFGEVLNHKIPLKTFSDKEDGNTRQLKLMVLYNKLSLTRMHWLQFDSINQILKGIKLDTENLGRQEFTYTLAAVDSGSRIARTEFQVVLKTPPYQKKKRINHEFTVKLDADYNVFISMSSNTIDVIENLARLFGVEDPYKEISVLRIEPGSVLFTFTMRKVRFSPCPSKELRELTSKLITRNGTINQNLVDQLNPKWRVKGVSVKPLGPCNDLELPYLQAYDTQIPHYPPYNEVGSDKEGTSDGALITYIIPGAILALVFIIAIIVACCLHRKRKAKRMEREKNHFANKGIPVIFADELEEKPDPPSKPLIMPDEKPPMAQPPYMTDSRDSPGLDRQRTTYADYDRDGPPPYRPPPPFASNGHDTRSKPRSNNHKHPHTYISP